MLRKRINTKLQSIPNYPNHAMQQNNIIFLYAIFNFLERNRITFNNQRE